MLFKYVANVGVECAQTFTSDSGEGRALSQEVVDCLWAGPASGAAIRGGEFNFVEVVVEANETCHGSDGCGVLFAVFNKG